MGTASVATGSKSVMTMNLPRLVQDATTKYFRDRNIFLVAGENIPEQNQQFAQVTPVKKDQNKHYQPYSGQQSPPSQQFQPYQNISQFYPQQGYPSQHHHHQNQKQNIPMGFPPMPNQYQQQFYPQQGHHHQKQPQKYYQQIPVPQQYQNQRGVQKGYGVQGSYLAQNAPMSAQFRGQNNYVFRARKKEVNRYDSNNDRYINYTSEENYFYPASAKKRGSNRKLVFECPIHKKLIHNTSSNNVNRNLSYGYKKATLMLQKVDILIITSVNI
jgi:hypothetical protein